MKFRSQSGLIEEKLKGEEKEEEKEEEQSKKTSERGHRTGNKDRVHLAS